MGEVVQFSVGNGETLDNENPDAHFESQREAAQTVQEELEKTHSWLEEKFPNIFMPPGEVITFLEETRNKIANDSGETVKQVA